VARAAARQISFADVELMRQGVRLEPLLEAISSFLDRQHEMAERVRRDLVRGLKKPRKGRRGLTAPQVLRSLVLMRVKNWDYRELRERIADGLTLRQFTDFYCDPVPKHDAFNRGFKVSGNQRSRRFLAHLFAPGRPFWHNEIAEFRGTVPDTHFDIVCQS
jgi:transposase, IS5 family